MSCGNCGQDDHLACERYSVPERYEISNDRPWRLNDWLVLLGCVAAAALLLFWLLS